MSILKTESITDNGALRYEHYGWGIEIHPDRPWTIHLGEIVGDGHEKISEARVSKVEERIVVGHFDARVPKKVKTAAQRVAENHHQQRGGLRALASMLEEVQQPLNDGRGVNSALTVISYLNGGNLHKARIVCMNEADKLGSFPALRRWLIANLFAGCKDHPWSYLESVHR